jgi:uncharacterized repeat protein (TIGR03837 family)
LTGNEKKDRSAKLPDTMISCDIFCKVIDNFGDIGVSWRLAQQLANEFGLTVRLWVNELKPFTNLYPLADATPENQTCHNVQVLRWRKIFPDVLVADLVIATFDCKLPASYQALMAAREKKPVWINLEYLSAQSWVEGCHKLPSPRPPLTRYFFFPGFTKKTGGLLLEGDLLERRDAFLNDPIQQSAFWQSIQVTMPAANTLTVSLFAYENKALSSLFDAWATGSQRVLCLVPPGRILPQIRRYFGQACHPHDTFEYKNLTVYIIPFLEQVRYDELLWVCDVNFVRGEDSLVRAQWAGKPFVWQIYPQHDEIHQEKLLAFLSLYGATLAPVALLYMRNLWLIWNGIAAPVVPELAWNAFDGVRDKLRLQAQTWAQELAKNNLALNLLDFFQEIGTIGGFEIDEQ